MLCETQRAVSWLPQIPSDPTTAENLFADLPESTGLFTVGHWVDPTPASIGAGVFNFPPAVAAFTLLPTGIITEPFGVFLRIPAIQVRVSALCQDRLDHTISTFESLPDSYNKYLVQGAADYCSRVLTRLDEGVALHHSLLEEVRRFATNLDSLSRQYPKSLSSSFELLDLTLIEDRFERIQNKSAALGLLPRLENLSMTEIVKV